ncbi:hypothetical protein CSA37_05820 [Candidatus Fermentibacteria bacterium]|nr:MAG: hypothetical protein CSA37_05820 [Candidatus Fermentibacteria bacterium]
MYVSFSHKTTSNQLVQFDQIYLNLHLDENFSLRGGQFKVPFGYAYTRSGGSMYFADRAAIGTGSQYKLYGGKDIGAMLTVNYQPVTFDLMISNGTGSDAHADTTINKQITARIAAEPADWLTVGASYARIGRPEIEDSTGTTEEWSSMGMDFYAVAEYPLSPSGTLLFTGEYMMLGYNGADVEGQEHHDGSRMSLMLGYKAELNSDVLVSVLPAVRYDACDPIASWAESADEPEDNRSFLDYCVNLGLFNKRNTLQIGARSYSRENDDWDGYTDMYANWRINF